jgi:hypothetical protein
MTETANLALEASIVVLGTLLAACVYFVGYVYGWLNCRQAAAAKIQELETKSKV